MKLRSLLFATSCLFAAGANAESFSLPIWKEEAEALGYKLPKAFGLNLSYMSMEQGINVESIALQGLNLGPFGVEMEAEPGKQVTDVITLRADMWLFPFLNLYALVGKLEGYSETSVDYTVGIKGKNKFIPIYKDKIEKFSLDLDGDILGAGFVLAGGYEQWFALVDASYTQTKLTVIDGAIDAYVVSPRVGYDFHRNGVPLRVWVGAMYQDVEQQLSGSLDDLLNMPLDGSFEVKQSLASEWNTLAGMQYQINDSLYLLGEMGFGERESLFFSFDYRF
ncbi:TonB-dependent receptor [Vibrio rhodolitus]|uniref:TonB-dependent receptor n=1 Tax=Vibrio rhodolitus TaxID=2231649 RepID=UPI000E0AB94D|nr:TonB-dependent receptor [Vibrio rhodolitus]